jgi:hypothetical protein
MKTLQLIIFPLLLQCTAFADDVIRGDDHFEFSYQATLPQLDGKTEIWLPLAKSDAFQTVEVERISLPAGWRKIEDRDYKNEIVALTLDPAEGGKSNMTQNAGVSRRRVANRRASQRFTTHWVGRCRPLSVTDETEGISKQV